MCIGASVYSCVVLRMHVHRHMSAMSLAPGCVFTLKSFLLSSFAYRTAPDDGALVIKDKAAAAAAEPPSCFTFTHFASEPLQFYS